VDPHDDFYPWLTVAVIAWGVLNCFFGYRVFKVTLALQGGLAGAGAGKLAATAMGLGPMGITVALIAGGLLGAGLAFLMYIAAVFVAGFFFGAALGMLLLANYHHMIALLTGCVLGIVGGFLAVKVQRVLIILSTALVGAFLSILTLSYFTNRIDWTFYARQPDQLPALIDSNGWMLPAILALATVGVIAQFELGPMKSLPTPLILSLLLSLFLAGCGGPSNVTVGLKTELVAVARQSNGQTLVTWRAVNPNVVPYLLASATHRVYLDGILIGSVTDREALAIPAQTNQDHTVALTLVGGGAEQALAKAATVGSAAYRLETTVIVRLYGEETEKSELRATGTVPVTSK
jgi:LEA14-like dessication related protein